MSEVNIKPEKSEIIGGKVVFLFTCPKCSCDKEIGAFGTRKMGGEIKKQSWCRSCRGPAAKKSK